MLAKDHELLDPSVVGFKFARQAKLRNDGFPVPQFCCIPGVVFDTVVGEIIAEHADSPADLKTEREMLAWAARMRARIADRAVPPGIAGGVVDRFDHIAGDGLAAVRACAVAAPDGQGEDGGTDPFAGLSDSFLDVGRAEVLQRVADCWASGYSDRAVRYRIHRGLDPLSVSIAVGVQEMVIAERSFVAFTRDPVDGSDRCVIAAAYGYGEGVVQEKADLDHFYVDLAGKTVQSRLAPKTGPDMPVLTDSEALGIAAIAAQVEAYFGTPQDIEGAITADRRVMLVQARPVVYPAPPPVPPPVTGKQLIWGNSNLTEGFPGVSCALTYSVAAQYGELSFTDFYRRMGVPAQVLAARRYDLARLLGHLRGRMYYRLDTWYALHAQIPSFAALRATWEQSMGLPPQARTTSGQAAGRGRRAAHYAGLAVRLPRHRAQVRQFLTWWDGYHARFASGAWAEQSAARVVEDYHRLWVEVGERWGIGSVNNFYLLLIGRLTNSLVRRWLPGSAPGTLTGMLCGARENRSVAAIRSALELAERTRRSAPLSAVLGRQDDELVWEDLAAGTYGDDLAAAALEHVRRYGDRSLQDLKMESVTIRQEPWRLLQIVRAYVGESLTVAGNRAQELHTRAEAERQLRARCRNPVRRAVLRGCYAVLREFLCSREDMRFCRSQLFGVSRAMLFELASRLVKASLLEAERDVLDLTAPEVLGAFSGTLSGPDLSELAQVRRAKRHAWAAEPDLPPLLHTDEDSPVAAAFAAQEPSHPPADGPAAKQLTGIASSPGRVRGRAKVIGDPAIDASECRDRILVARETDPGWLFLMMAAKGIVVERGSPVSHTAITGRMLAIPTVVAVTGATRLIRDGDWIELDGTAGTVTLGSVTVGSPG